MRSKAKKLTLNKITLANLSEKALNRVQGGLPDTLSECACTVPATCPDTCPCTQAGNTCEKTCFYYTCFCYREWTACSECWTQRLC
jgi:hypothetical protein